MHTPLTDVIIIGYQIHGAVGWSKREWRSPNASHWRPDDRTTDPIRHSHISDHSGSDIPPHRVAQDHPVLSHVAGPRVLDQLQHSGGRVVDSQGRDHSARVDIWPADLATVFRQPVDQCHADMGQLQETVAHAGWLQHLVDMAQHDGDRTVGDTRIAVMHNEH